MKDSLCKCYTGRLSRLINCLNGFFDDVEVKIGDNQQIGNIISLVRQQLEKKGEVNNNEWKRLVTKELQERKYTKEEIETWTSYIE